MSKNVSEDAKHLQPIIDVIAYKHPLIKSYTLSKQSINDNDEDESKNQTGQDTYTLKFLLSKSLKLSDSVEIGKNLFTNSRKASYIVNVIFIAQEDNFIKYKLEYTGKTNLSYSGPIKT